MMSPGIRKTAPWIVTSVAYGKNFDQTATAFLLLGMWGTVLIMNPKLFFRPFFFGLTAGISFTLVADLVRRAFLRKRLLEIAQTAARYSQGDFTPKTVIESDRVFKVLRNAIFPC